MLQYLAGPLLTLIERIFPDKAEQDRAKAEMMSIMAQAQAEEYKARSSVIVAEAKGESWLQRNWRPIIAFSNGMFMVTALAFNVLVAPLLLAFGADIVTVSIPSEVYAFNTLCITGYMGMRSYDKRTQALNDEAYFKVLQKQLGPLSQEFVDIQNEALKAARDESSKH